MQAYKIKTTVSSDGKISLPQSMQHLFSHSVEVILLEIGENGNSKKEISEAVMLLDQITSAYVAFKEEDLDIQQIFIDRTKSNDREIDFN